MALLAEHPADGSVAGAARGLPDLRDGPGFTGDSRPQGIGIVPGVRDHAPHAIRTDDQALCLLPCAPMSGGIRDRIAGTGASTAAWILLVRPPRARRITAASGPPFARGRICLRPAIRRVDKDVSEIRPGASQDAETAIRPPACREIFPPRGQGLSLRAGSGNAIRVSPARAERCPADRQVREGQRPAPAGGGAGAGRGLWPPAGRVGSVAPWQGRWPLPWKHWQYLRSSGRDAPHGTRANRATEASARRGRGGRCPGAVAPGRARISMALWQGRWPLPGGEKRAQGQGFPALRSASPCDRNFSAACLIGIGGAKYHQEYILIVPCRRMTMTSLRPSMGHFSNRRRKASMRLH